jgi:type I restriction enzyme S subunit
MSSEWDSLPLEDCLDALIDYRGKTPVKTSFGIPLITAKIIKSGRIEKPTEFIAVEDYESWMRRGIPKSGDVVLTVEAPLGEVAQLGAEKIALAQRVVTLRGKVDFLDSTYLLYWLQSQDAQEQLKARATGTTVLGIKQSELRKLSVPIPPIKIQKEIAHILRALDDRIALFHEANATLKAIAQALFKSWFVDFDPVRAKSEGKFPEGMDKATAAIFPDTFEETELGMVPKGWQVQKFGDFIERLYVGKKFDQKSALVSGAVPILDQGKSGIIGFHNEVPSVKATLETPVVVFANHTCYMRLICFDFSAIQNVLPFIGKGVDTVWAFYATKDRIKFSEYKGHWPDFAIEKTVVPSEELTHLYRRSVDSAVRRMRLNEMQAETLTNLRDTLLPRLISRQLRIADAEAELKKVSA